MVSTRSKKAPKGGETAEKGTKTIAKVSRGAVSKATESSHKQNKPSSIKSKTSSARQPLSEKSPNKGKPKDAPKANKKQGKTTKKQLSKDAIQPLEDAGHTSTTTTQSSTNSSQPKKRAPKNQKLSTPPKRMELLRIDDGGDAQADDNFIVEAFLMDAMDPPIERKLSCPASATMESLHIALQIAFGWASCHMWQFRFMSGDAINGIAADSAKAETLQVSPEDDLCGIEGIKERKARDILISDMLTDRSWLGAHENGRFIYEYDMGCSWEHALQVVGRAPHKPYFECLSGQGHPAAEDTFPPQWQDLKDAYRKPKNQRDKDEQYQISWYQTMCANGDPKGLGGKGAERWSMKAVNEDLKGYLGPYKR